MSYQSGQPIGNYRLVRLIGQGTYGWVYLAEHVHLGTQAAIKLLKHQVEEHGKEQEAFLQEARMIASLRHPHIVRVLDFGFEAGIPYLVTEYAPNGTLRQKHPRGSCVLANTVLTYLQQIADGLQYAHDRQIIHRDLKPDNLLVDGDRQIVISDFGIALTGSRHVKDTVIAGTAAYMAPEQFAGKPRRASDQYALGIVVYEWLAGTLPFHGSFVELAAQHLSATPTPLRDRNPDISPDVEQVVCRAIAKDPEQRFASVLEFTEAFAQAVAIAPNTTIRPISPVVQTALPGTQIVPIQDSRAAVQSPPLPDQRPRQNMPVISKPTYLEAIRDLGPDVQVHVKRSRTLGFLITHPTQFSSGRRWVRADKITGLDALDICNAFSDDQEVMVKKKGEGIINMRQALQSVAEPLGDTEMRKHKKQWGDYEQSSPRIQPLLHFACAVSWIVWFFLMCFNGNSIGDILLLRWNNTIPQQSWIILFSSIGLFFGCGCMMGQTTENVDDEEALFFLTCAGIVLLTWMCSSCIVASWGNTPFTIGSLIVGVIFPGLLLCIITIPVGAGATALGYLVGTLLKR